MKNNTTIAIWTAARHRAIPGSQRRGKRPRCRRGKWINAQTYQQIDQLAAMATTENDRIHSY
jgi:hypothetical protein